ncbi:MAG: ABC transporter ATP-binding protein [Deltaproteobacteria bacterium]|nr:ABC transporter ATP-binding protein [Deltaproteobacteria bacterium]
MIATLRKCLLFLSPQIRWRWAGLIPLAVAAALLETLGAAAVFALMKIISDPSHVSRLPVVSAIYRVLPWREGRAVVLSFTVLVALFYILKNGLLAVAAYVQNKVVSDSMAALSRRMLQGYLMVPYAFHFRRNSAELIRNTSDSAEAVFRLVMVSAVSAISEVLVEAGIITVLMVTAPGVTLFAIVVLFGMLAVLLKLTRRVFTRWGVREQELKRAILQSLQQSLGGLKEIKVMGRERFFYEGFASRQGALVRIRSLHTTLVAVPRLLIETVFVCGMLLVITLVTARDSAGPDLVPLLGLYAYAGFRVIPSVNRILLNLNDIRYGAAATQRLYNDFVAFGHLASGAFAVSEGEDLTFTDCISLEQVSYTYDGAPTPVLHDVTLTIRRGESLGIVGPTGAGKSTLIDLILGLLQPSGGRITVDGRDIVQPLRSWQRKIGYVPQSIFLTDDSMRRNIAFGLRDVDIDERKVQAAVRLAQLEEYVASLPHGLDTIVGERGVRLSGGQRQRVAIARALYHEPEVLVFDEATSALDNQTEREVIRAIEALRGEKTLLVVAHRLSTVRACDRLVFLCDGCVAGYGSFDDLMAHNPDFRRMAAVTDPSGADT